jgi:hypothetical protein
MRIAGENIGVRGLTLLAAAGVAGIVLGVHGWSLRHQGLPSAFAGPQASPRTSAGGAGKVRHVSGRSAGPTSAPTHGPSAPAPTSSAAAPPAPGPKLSSQAYASYAFRVWPGPVSKTASTAATGLVIKVHRHGSGIAVAASVAGQPPAAPRFYAAGAIVYVVEAALGDDSGNTDYNLGDDGLVVTDAQGRIVQ